MTKSAGNCVATYFTRTPEDTMGHGIIIGLNFSFTFIDNVFWLIILSRFFIRGWYITTNDTPWLPLSFLFVFICSTFVNFLPCHKSEPPLTHFLNVFCWLLLCLWMIACYMNELANFYSSCSQSIYSKVPNHKSAYGERVGGVWGQIFFLRLL